MEQLKEKIDKIQENIKSLLDNLNLINARIENALKAIEKLEKEFAGNGRVLIRPSGTEPLVRVMIEGEDQEYITKKAQEIADLIEKKLK